MDNNDLELITLDASLIIPDFDKEYEDARNALGDGYNPNRDQDGKFSDGLSVEVPKKMTTAKENEKKLEAARLKMAQKSSTAYSELSAEQYQQAINTDYGDQAQYEERESDEVSRYASLGYEKVNPALKKVGGLVEALDNDTFLTVNVLDGAMKNHLKEDTTLFRGIASKQDIKRGQFIDYDGYSSSSFFQRKGEEFATEEARYNEGTMPYLLTINANQGQRGIITMLASPKKGVRASEGEFMLPRGLSLEVIKRIEHDNYVELVTEIRQ